MSNNIDSLISFGSQPNSYTYISDPDIDCDIHDLTLDYCKSCGFVFISDPISPKRLYDNDTWPTSFSQPGHLNWLLGTVVAELRLNTDDLIIDLGCNDGYLLSRLKRMDFDNMVGIEPAVNCAKLSAQKKITTINAFFDADVVDQVKKKYGTPKVIFCRHVIEHIPQLNIFLNNVCSLVDKSTILVLEYPNFEYTAEKGDISTIWEQHVSYFTFNKMAALLHRFGFKVFFHKDVEYGGGSTIIFARKGNSHTNLENESKLALEFKKRAVDNIKTTGHLIKRLKERNKKIVAYGAGSRGVSFINLSNIAEFIDYIVDDNPDKYGWFLPKSKIPVFNSEILLRDKPNYCLIMPLNSKASERRLMNKNKQYLERGGEFIEFFPGHDRDSLLLSEDWLEMLSVSRRAKKA